MFTTLLESRAPRARQAGSTALSAVLHGAIIAGAVALTWPTTGEATIHPTDPEPVVHFAPIIDRTPTQTSRPLQAQPSGGITFAAPPLIPPTDIPIGLPPIDLAQPTIGDETTFGLHAGLPTDGMVAGGGAPTPTGISDVADVERIPRVIGQPPAPRYPSALRQSGMDGKVMIRFVIDTLGRAELEGVVVQESSHPLFTDAVRSALAQFRFSPGEVGGRKVRTMVQLPFTFALR